MSDFADKVFAVVRLIPRGKVTAYAQVAKLAGKPKAARAVGNILNKNPHLIKVPCHRVVRSDGRAGGYVRGKKEKEWLLKKEGVKIKNGKVKLCKG